MKAFRINVEGIVQGVGFRPFVYRLAAERGLAGFVENNSRGVAIEVEGPEAGVTSFLAALESETPPQAIIDRTTVVETAPTGRRRFEIRESGRGEGATRISPDIAVCGDCLREMSEAGGRRHGYPFINCTNCGPRLSIILATPYDRPATTMGVFEMCPQCLREYRDPSDRRFHAQPNACPACGPRVWACDASGNTVAEGGGAIGETARKLAGGGIAAIKGVGGFHICCDATNAEAVARLRELKRRPHKPLALMAGSVKAAKRACHVSDLEEKLLGSPQAPIMLCRKNGEWGPSESIAPGNKCIGVMLPYAPLHHLVFRALESIDKREWLLVMTSGNVQDLPIISDNGQAQERLSGIAGLFLMHDRGIENRNDDSIAMAVEPGEGPPLVQIIRHSRGYAPNPVTLPREAGPCLAVGGQMKDTFCLAQGAAAFLSQHIGEADSLETMDFFREMYEKYRRWFKIEPRTVVHDLHPDYLTTRWARSLEVVETEAVQHHHAHLLSVLADNRTVEPAVGVILDGTGYGTDGRIWGGEFLFFDGAGIERLGHLEYLPLPGGEAAIRNPWRIAAAYGLHLGIDAAARCPGVSPEEMEAVLRQTEAGINLAWTSSLGRLYDAASAALGICQRITFEAQAAMALEAAAWGGGDGSYGFEIEDQGNGPSVVRLGSLWRGLTEDAARGVDAGTCAARFQNTVVDFAIAMCDNIKLRTGCSTAALSGGVFQNRWLLERISSRLASGGFKVLLNRQVPSNDGGLALGQVLHHALGL